MYFLRRFAIVTSALAMMGGVLVAVPAAAVDSAPAPTISAQGALAAPGYDCWRYGYWGTFNRPCDWIVDVYWDNDTVESFGIAPDRTIWHAWPGSGRWLEMPNNGRADWVVDAFHSTSGTRLVMVAVGPWSYWCSENLGGRWSTWFRCIL